MTASRSTPNKSRTGRARSRRETAGGDVPTLASRLRPKRLELGWTQEQLAAEVKSSQAVIQKIENGKSLRPRILEEIAYALGVSPAWLTYGAKDCTNLESEAIELARSWQSLEEPHRTAMKKAIFEMAQQGRTRSQ